MRKKSKVKMNPFLMPKNPVAMAGMMAKPPVKKKKVSKKVK